MKKLLEQFIADHQKLPGKGAGSLVMVKGIDPDLLEMLGPINMANLEQVSRCHVLLAQPGKEDEVLIESSTTAHARGYVLGYAAAARFAHAQRKAKNAKKRVR